MRNYDQEARAAEVRESIRPRWLYGLRGLVYALFTIRDAARGFFRRRAFAARQTYTANGYRWHAVVIAVRGRREKDGIAD